MSNQPSAPAPIRVVLLDDHEIVRHGVADLVNAQADMEVVGEAGTAADMLATVAQEQPDVAVLDVRLGDDSVSGIATCREISRAYPETRCLILTSFADDEAVVDASLAGAAGFVLKQIRGNDLITSIRKVAGGTKLLDAAQTRLAEKTVKNYVSNVLAKLGLVRRTEAAALAARLDERQKRKYRSPGGGLLRRCRCFGAYGKAFPTPCFSSIEAGESRSPTAKQIGCSAGLKASPDNWSNP